MMCGKYSYEDTYIACGYSDGIVRIFSVNT